MGAVGTLTHAVVLGPGLAVFCAAPCLLTFFMGRLPAPSREIDGPPRFAVETGAPAKRRFFTVAWADMVLALIPGLLAWRGGEPNEAAKQAALGWGALLVLVVVPRSSFVLAMAGALAYWTAYQQALKVAREGDATDRWMGFLVGIDADMVKAECTLPSCPRCRLRPRAASGWCPSCDAALAAHALRATDWRARVGSRQELARDGTLFPGCAARMVRSYFGAGSEAYEIPRKARRSGVPLGERPKREGDPDWEYEIEVAYADPARPDLVWTRTRERLAPPGGDAYESRRVEAWGFVDDQFTQAWIFAPVTRGVVRCS